MAISYGRLLAAVIAAASNCGAEQRQKQQQRARPVVPAPSLPADICVGKDGRNVSCGPTTSQRCQSQEIWPRPGYHVMDFYCGENDPNGPFVSKEGVYHLFYQDHIGLPNRNSSWPGAGLSWGHAASPNLAQWVYLPIGLWGGVTVSDRDCGGLSTGSTTMVDGVPTIVYPGGCHENDPNAASLPGGVGAGNAYSVAIPADNSDKLAKAWKRIGPIINNTDNDPSEAWRTAHGEWRLLGHGGGGKCRVGGPLNGSDCAPMWATADPSFRSGWYKVGISPVLGGECQNGPYPLPPLYPGTSPPTEAGELPTHVHHTGAKYMMGTFVDGPPGIGDNMTGSFTPTPGVPFVQFLEDHGQYYASKGFTDRSAARGKRRVIFGWNKAKPSSQTLPRVVRYHPEIRRLVFSPAPELRLLRKHQLQTVPNNTVLRPNVSTPLNASVWPPGEGRQASVAVRWKRPKGKARLSLTVSLDEHGQGGMTISMTYTPPPTPNTRAWNVSVDGTCATGRGANQYSCEGLWLLSTDDIIELTAFVDNTVVESFWMDGRIALTLGLPFSGNGGGMAVEVTAGEDVILESVEVHALNDCWINESTALEILSGGSN